MKMLLKPVQWIYCIYALLLFIVLMLGVLPFVIVALFLGEIKGGNLIYKACKTWGFCWYFSIGIKQENIYEAPHDSSSQYIFVANHISYMDIPPAFMSFRQPMRILAKYELARSASLEKVSNVADNNPNVVISTPNNQTFPEFLRVKANYTKQGISFGK